MLISLFSLFLLKQLAAHNYIGPGGVLLFHVHGDPHFTMWDNTHFSYHGQCDLVLFSNPKFAHGSDMTIQLRTEIREYYSFIRSIAIRIGDENFEIEGNGGGMNFYYNGEAIGEPVTTLAGYEVRKVVDPAWCKEKCSEGEIYSVDIKDRGSVELGSWGSFLHIKMALQQAFYNGSVGLTGNYETHGFISRIGDVLQSADLFGQNWQVLDTEPMLFHKKRYPQYPERCIMPQPIARRIIRDETREMAQKVCSHLSDSLRDMCIFDVEATGDERLALSPLYG